MADVNQRVLAANRAAVIDLVAAAERFSGDLDDVSPVAPRFPAPVGSDSVVHGF